MTKTIAIATAVTIAIILACSCAIAEVPQVDRHTMHCQGMYPRLAIFTKLDYELDIVTVTDAAGFDWQFDCCDDWVMGDYVTMMMYDSETPYEIEDDVIVLAFWGGWTAKN